jgi:hypothetical protein
MGGSTADTPATPESLRVSDADRDHAVDELRSEFVEGRLSHETFVYRMQTALDARNRGQLAGLFTDLPPRRGWLLARIRTGLRRLRVPGEPGEPGGPGRDEDRASRYRGPVPAPGAGPVPLFFPLGRGDRFTIGRTRDCDLCLADLSVSRRHAELVRGADGWLLNDLGSHNGTRLNGWLVREPVPVRAGDRLEFGSATFLLANDPHGRTSAG